MGRQDQPNALSQLSLSLELPTTYSLTLATVVT